MSDPHRCPLCGSVDVRDAGLASFQMLSASRCKACGARWRSSWSPGAAVVSILVGGSVAVVALVAVVDFGGYLVSAFVEGGFEIFGFSETLVGLLTAAFALAFLVLGCRAVWAGCAELASLGRTPRILKRGAAPSTSPEERTRGEDC